MVAYAETITDFHSVKGVQNMDELVQFLLTKSVWPGFESSELLGTHTVIADDLTNVLTYQVCNDGEGSPCNVNSNFGSADVVGLLGLTR